MTTKTKTRPRVGDEAWFVEWCEVLTFHDNDPENGVDTDACKMLTRKFSTRDEAAQFAREVWPKTHNAWGCVTYWPSRFVAYDEDDAAEYAALWHAHLERLAPALRGQATTLAAERLDSLRASYARAQPAKA